MQSFLKLRSSPWQCPVWWPVFCHLRNKWQCPFTSLIPLCNAIIYFLALFGKKFQQLSKTKKVVPKLVSAFRWFLPNFRICNQKLFLLARPRKFGSKSIFLPFSQNTGFFSKIWCQKWILWLISFQKIYTMMYFALMFQKLMYISNPKRYHLPWNWILPCSIYTYDIIMAMLETAQMTE